MSKFVKTRIEAANKVMKDIEVMVNNKPDFQEYLTMRSELNIQLIQAVVGGKLIQKESKKNGVINKIRFSEKLPTTSELSEICSLLETFIEETEQPYIYAMSKKLSEAESDDMEIDVPIPMIHIAANVGKIDKINASKMNECIFGNSSEYGIAASSRINEKDIMELAANAEKLRKHQNRNKAFIIGGITLLAVGGGITAAAIHNKHKKEDIIDDTEHEVFDESTDIDMDVDDTIDMDAPVVSMDE